MRSRHGGRQADCAGIPGDEARPCRSPDADDRARHGASRTIVFGARPHRGDHRPRQFYRAAGGTIRRPRDCIGRRQAGGGSDHADGLCRTRGQRTWRTSGHRGDRCAARSRVLPGGRRRRHVVDRTAGCADRRRARGMALRTAAPGRQRRRDPRRALAGACGATRHGRCAGGTRYCLGGVARRRGQSGKRAGPALLSARARCQASKKMPPTTSQPTAS